MLYGYPADAIGENWVQDCIAEVLERIHNSLDAGSRSTGWPEIIPVTYRSRLKSKGGLKTKLTKYRRSLSRLTSEERKRVLRTFKEENQIAHLLACMCSCETIEQIPEGIREPVRELFGYLFGLLTDLGIRDRAYQSILAAVPYHICAFCGLEGFDAPGAPREALDHYLSEARYPFAGANLQNLVPMCGKCNSKYKLAKDILRKEDGTRRRSFNPYQVEVTIKISLVNSRPFGANDDQLPAWAVEFEPGGEEVITWNDVFCIRERYARDILDCSFKEWLRNFWSFCKAAKISLTAETLLDALERYATFHEDCGISDKSFLKAAVFRMILLRCSQGDDRLADLVSGRI